jgi:DnaJ-class molecular chaperone
MQQYYDLLGVTINSSDDEIKQKFRQLAMKHHPDREGNSDKFNEVVQAYKYITKVNNNFKELKNLNQSNDEFFKKMFGSKYGPYR